MKAQSIKENLASVLTPKNSEEIADLEKRGFRKSKGKWKFGISIAPLLRTFEEYEDAGEFRRNLLELLRGKVEDVEIYLGEDKEYELTEFENIIDEFEMLDQEPEPDEVDYPLGLLYDWADENNVWIDSFE